MQLIIIAIFATSDEMRYFFALVGNFVARAQRGRQSQRVRKRASFVTSCEQDFLLWGKKKPPEASKSLQKPLKRPGKAKNTKNQKCAEKFFPHCFVFLQKKNYEKLKFYIQLSKALEQNLLITLVEFFWNSTELSHGGNFIEPPRNSWKSWRLFNSIYYS